MRRYPSKLLLFGEHILLIGARALAAPVAAFGGEWAWRAGATADAADALAQRLAAFAASTELAGIDGLDTARFKEELRAGLYFKSNIPIGYGLGSSGALCAAVYDRFVKNKTADLAALKRLFAHMECFFHGQSSGIDPLTSYLNRPLLISHKTEVQFFEAQPWPSEAPVVFLIDSRRPRQTGPLVQWFLERSREPDFHRLLETDLLPAHEALLDAWQLGDTAGFWPALFRVSHFQLEHFRPMVPEGLEEAWRLGLNGGQYLLKVCGAGGGGFVLGFAHSREAVLESLSEFAPVFPFDDHGLVEK